MSVINQMLRDLDTRNASDQERAGLPGRLRTLPPSTAAKRQQWRMLMMGIGIGAVLAALVATLLVWWLLPSSPPPQPAPVTASAAPIPPAASVANAVAPASPRAAVPPAPTSPAPKEPPSVRVEAADKMKLSTLLTHGQQVPAPPPATATPAADKAAGEIRPSRDSQSHPASPAGVAAESKDPPDGQIDKRSRGGEARDMAENEYRKAMQAVRRGDSPASIPLFQKALEFDPGLAKARQALLSVLVGGRHWAEAQQVVQSGLALDPAQSGWATILARLQFEQGDANGGIETLARHAAHATGDAEYQGLFAYLLQKQQRHAEAAQRFQAALALRPAEGRWWFGLGLALESAGQTAEAKDAYARAREVGNLPADMQGVIEQKLR